MIQTDVAIGYGSGHLSRWLLAQGYELVTGLKGAVPVVAAKMVIGPSPLIQTAMPSPPHHTTSQHAHDRLHPCRWWFNGVGDLLALC